MTKPRLVSAIPAVAFAGTSDKSNLLTRPGSTTFAQVSVLPCKLRLIFATVPAVFKLPEYDVGQSELTNVQLAVDGNPSMGKVLAMVNCFVDEFSLPGSVTSTPSLLVRAEIPESVICVPAGRLADVIVVPLSVKLAVASSFASPPQNFTDFDTLSRLQVSVPSTKSEDETLRLPPDPPILEGATMVIPCDAVAFIHAQLQLLLAESMRFPN